MTHNPLLLNFLTKFQFWCFVWSTRMSFDSTWLDQETQKKNGDRIVALAWIDHRYVVYLFSKPWEAAKIVIGLSKMWPSSPKHFTWGQIWLKSFFHEVLSAFAGWYCQPVALFQGPHQLKQSPALFHLAFFFTKKCIIAITAIHLTFKTLALRLVLATSFAPQVVVVWAILPAHSFVCF